MIAKFLTFLSISTFLTLTSHGQGKLEFKKDTHEFGVVTEGTQATYDFEFTNTGNAPVVISNVAASCGCTTPFWTKEPVLPGKKGKVTASYNSMGRPGVFHKTVTVTSNGQNAMLVLTIKGTVQSKSEAPVTPEQLDKAAVLKLDKTAHNFGKIEKNRSVTHNFTVINTGKSDLQLQTVQSGCNCVSFKISQPAVKPGEKATLELRYTPLAMGQQNETVTILSNDLRNPSTSVVLQANIVESLTSQSMLKEQKPAVPFK